MPASPDIDLRPIAQDLKLDLVQVQNVVRLLDDGNTVPFITRYRKELTRNLDEDAIRAIQLQARSRRQLADRAAQILRAIEGQSKLTPQLRKAIESADSLKRLEDLYLPFRPKRRTRAQAARDLGLQSIADQIWNATAPTPTLEQLWAAAVRSNPEIADLETAQRGTSDILAEQIAEQPDVRAAARQVARLSGRLAVTSKGTASEKSREFADYFDYSESLRKIPPHRVLAINRGERGGHLRVRFEWDARWVLNQIDRELKLQQKVHATFLTTCVQDAISRLLHPSLERELRREATEQAERHAVSVFAKNLRNLLLQPPMTDKRILAIDPGLRTGCKLAVLDEFGDCVYHDLIYVTGNTEKRAANRSKLEQILRDHECHVVAIGNGTACRETEELVSELAAESSWDINYVIVNEAGASVYSTSPLAGEEFPDLDATVRGTISIGRRLRDPLSELVKIDPQHIGVGMYQHDVSPKHLEQSLDEVIESCVNYVGVDLNTASVALLRRVSGFNQSIARKVVERRAADGPFQSRQELLSVSGIGEAIFTQSAGFLKVTTGKEPLDNTWIHPESYSAAHRLLQRLQIPVAEALSSESTDRLRDHIRQLDTNSVARDLKIGVPTLQDILQSLMRPGRDPRIDLPAVEFRKGILKLEDLTVGMELRGTVLNVVDFGAFVDIGLKDSGLVHISKMSKQFVQSPHECVAVGDTITVWVLDIDPQRRRVSLTMIPPEEPTQVPAQAASRGKPASAPTDTKRKRKSVQRKSQSDSTGDSSKPSDSPPAAVGATAGKQPLKGFDQLKSVWEQSRGSEPH